MLNYHDGSKMLSHFIRSQHLVRLLEDRAFTLVRADRQPKDSNDSMLPSACFDRPYRGWIENSFSMTDDFLREKARDIGLLRSRTHIMPWTYEPVGEVRQSYSEDGVRCEIRASEIQLMLMLGYYISAEAHMPPNSRMIPEIPGGRATAELKAPHYSVGEEAIPVVAFPSATARKEAKFKTDAEMRIEAIVMLDEIKPSDGLKSINWSLNSFAGLTISLGTKTSVADAKKIKMLAAKAGVPVNLRQDK